MYMDDLSFDVIVCIRFCMWMIIVRFRTALLSF